MDEQELIEYLETIIYPVSSASNIVQYVDKDGVIIVLDRTSIQSSFEKFVAKRYKD